MYWSGLILFITCMYSIHILFKLINAVCLQTVAWKLTNITNIILASVFREPLWKGIIGWLGLLWLWHLHLNHLLFFLLMILLIIITLEISIFIPCKIIINSNSFDFLNVLGSCFNLLLFADIILLFSMRYTYNCLLCCIIIILFYYLLY